MLRNRLLFNSVHFARNNNFFRQFSVNPHKKNRLNNKIYTKLEPNNKNDNNSNIKYYLIGSIIVGTSIWFTQKLIKINEDDDFKEANSLYDTFTPTKKDNQKTDYIVLKLKSGSQSNIKEEKTLKLDLNIIYEGCAVLFLKNPHVIINFY
jgi:hypothetical protein